MLQFIDSACPPTTSASRRCALATGEAHPAPRYAGRPQALRGGRLRLTALLVLAAGVPVFGVAAESTDEYDQKAAFLVNLLQFVAWPPGSADGTAPIVIGVLGDDPFRGRLEQRLTGETWQERPLSVRHFRRAKEVDRCHILFVSPSEKRRAGRLLKELRGRPILTVGEAGFIAAGGMVEMETRDRRVRLRIAPDNARAAGLEVSSKLLRLTEP